MMPLRKNTLNFIVDLLTLLTILTMIGTGLIMYFTLPPGSGSRGLILWGLGRHEWGDVHFWASVALGVLLILHVALHWSWVCGTIRRLLHGPSTARGRVRSRLDNAYGIVFLAALAGAFTALLLVANANVITSAEKAREHEQEHEPARLESPGAGRGGAAAAGDEDHERGASAIRGSMTLAEIAAQTGLSVADILEALQLPADTSPDERTGRLVRAHGLDMSAARELIEQRAAQSEVAE
ncbi:MAG: DUF4405 domain-containing protein [Planctomycetota bacterium]|nr:DUF4405 domain-containing protein [Planctomycetota bacterium]